jgi:hypothetical protein
MKVTLPVGVPDEDETVAVKITSCPTVAGFCEGVRPTVVAAGFTA